MIVFDFDVDEIYYISKCKCKLYLEQPSNVLRLQT